MKPENRRVPKTNDQGSAPAEKPEAEKAGRPIWAWLRTAFGVVLVLGIAIGMAWSGKRYVTTTNRFGMGNAGDTNKVRWDSNISRDFDRWVVDLSIPGSFTKFQFRIVYKHGVVGGADTDTFVGGGATGYYINKS